MSKKIGNPALAAALIPAAASAASNATRRIERERPKSGKEVILTAIDDIPPMVKGVLIVGIVGGAGFLIYRAVKKAKETAEQREIVKAEETTGEDNPWSANSFLGQRTPSNVRKLTSTQALADATTLYECFDVWIDEDEEGAVTLFTKLRSKYEVAQVVKAFEDKYKKGVLQTMKNGLIYTPNKGLSSENYKLIIDNVANKPKF